jgi:hypothetical protein
MAKPWQSRQEFLVDQALQAAISDPDTIRETRPVVPQQLFPERFGFARQEHNLMSVMNVDRYIPTYRSWMSGMPVMESSFQDGGFDGTGRYSMSSIGNV